MLKNRSIFQNIHIWRRKNRGSQTRGHDPFEGCQISHKDHKIHIKKTFSLIKQDNIIDFNKY